MPWKIVNLDYESGRPHLHIKDPNQPIHLRSYFDSRQVEIGLGADEPDECFVRATVSADNVIVAATKFEPRHVAILSSILASLDIDAEERDGALAWMNERLSQGRAPRDRDGLLAGNVDAFPPPTGWPYDLDDAALFDSIRDSEGIPSTRFAALLREAKRRGLRVETRSAGASDRTKPNAGAPGPEVFRRR